MVIVVPNFGRLTQGGARTAGRRLMGVIATVHDKAALQKRRFYLGMELGAGDYWAVATEPAEGLSNEDVLGRRDKAVLEGVLPGGTVFSDVTIEADKLKEGTALAVFEPNGTCRAAQIHLKDEDGGVYTLMVNPFTGRCTVYDSYLQQQGGGASSGQDQEESGPEGDQAGEAPAEEPESP
jgi:hypothetical protein